MYLMYLLFAVLAMTAVGLGFAAYVAATIKNEALRPTQGLPPFNVEVISVETDCLALRPTSDNPNERWKQDGRWGLHWEQGHAQLGRIVSLDSGRAVREFQPFVGSPQPGVQARLDWSAFPHEAGLAFGLEFESVQYVSPLGRFHASFLPGRRDTWLLFVHGKRGAAPRKPPYAYPILPAAAEKGFPCLDITYRNDHGEPASPDGFHRYGLTEWEDLEGAVRYTLDRGASGLILVGYSMGGAIVASFLYRSRLAGRIRGAILDAPVLDLNAVIAFGVHSRGVPYGLIRPGQWLAGVRFGIDWNALDYLKDIHNVKVPVLLFHGAEDPTVPVEISDRLAAMRPDIVTYVRVPGATHGHSWNVASERYEQAVHTFLDRFTP